MIIRKIGIALCLVAGVLAAGNAFAGEVVSKAADKITISGYTQGRAGYVADVPDSLINSAIFVRRARIKVAAKITDRTWSQIQVDFASSRLIKDAIVGIDISNALTVMAGQLKRPFSQEELFSSSALPAMERGLTNDLTSGDLGYSGRSQGIVLRGKTKGKTQLVADLGVFTGAGEADIGGGDGLLGIQTDFNNRGKDWVGRAAVNTGSDTKIRIAANASGRLVGGSYVDGAMVTHQSQSFTAYGGDTQIKHGPLSIWGELLTGDNYTGFTDTLSNFSAPTFLGYHIAAIYTKALGENQLITAIQPEFRFENLDPNTDAANDAASEITAGLSLFMGKSTRWRTSIVWDTFQGSTPSDTRIVSELQAKI